MRARARPVLCLVIAVYNEAEDPLNLDAEGPCAGFGGGVMPSSVTPTGA